MEAIDPQGLDKFAPKGLDWWDLCRGQLDIAIHTKCQIYKLWASRFQRFYLCFFSITSPSYWSTGNGEFGPQGLDWQDLCCGALDVHTK